ncbi:MAG TPA: Holliday junction branch migration protein RuvA [Hyphomicrobiaceae bacterium]|nr:Holliday junction branch migration protein RuvA [Hyphomicrobiaceae bacterium]
MIGRLRGKVDAIGESYLIVDVNGVGYEVQASARTLRSLELGQEVTLSIETHVREDAIRLFGFTAELERAWFRMLQSVQGVGAKVALGILGTLSAQDLINAIALGNWAAVEKAPGVGRKLAQRIVSELKEKAPQLSMGIRAAPAGVRANGASAASLPQESHVSAEAISALTNLGYPPQQAAAAIAAAIGELGEAADLAQLIKRGLRELAR